MQADVIAAFRFALDLAVKATLLFGITGLALLALRRTSASLRHAAGAFGLTAALLLPLLTAVVPRVAVPLLPSPVVLPTTVSAQEAPAESVALPAELPDSAVLDSERSAASANVATAEAVSPSATLEPVAVAARPAPPRSPFALDVRGMALVLAIWLAGTLALLARLTIGIVRVRRCRREAERVDSPEWTSLAAKIAAALGVSRPVEIRFVRTLPVAVTAGVRRPVLLLPESARSWDESRRRVVLLHEISHIARRDWPAFLLGEVAVAVYWFHPLAWVLGRRLRRDGERAADDRVIASGTKPSVYAGHLLGIIRSLRPGSWRETLPVMGMARPSHFEERLRAILSPGMRRRRMTAGQARVAALTVLAAAAAVAALQPWAPAGAAALEAPPPVSAGAGKCPNGKTHRGAPQHGIAGGIAGGVADGVVHAVRGGVPGGVSGGVAGGVSDGIPGGIVGDVVSAVAENVSAKVADEVVAHVSQTRSASGRQEYRDAAEQHEEGHYEEAARAFARAYEQGYRKPVAAYNAACAWARAGNREEAFRWLEKASAEGFRSTEHIGDDDDLASLRSDPKLPERLAHLGAVEIEAARKSPEGQEALRKFDDLTRNTPGNGEKLYASGKQMLRIGRYDLSERAFRLAARLGYRPGTSLYNAACALSRKGDHDGALDLLRQALEAGFDDPKLVRTDDDLEGIRGKPRYRELVALAEGLELKSDGGKVFNFGPRRDREAWRRAVPRYERFSAAHPELGRAWYNLGFARLAADDAEGARQAFEKSLSLDYRRAATLYNIGCAEARLNHKDRAFERIFQALDAGFDQVGTITDDEDIDSLRGDARFRQVLRRVEDVHRASK
jgi:beta-lactamase regulating signal transducer with metallopeptidase domain/tetratricopeptide (TPR) repeat protein